MTTPPDSPILLSKEELVEKFGLPNYLVFFCLLLVSAAIGAFFWWRGQKNAEDLLMGGRSMSTLPMTMSLVASFMSAITLLGTPAEVYTKGTQYIVLVLTYPFVMGAAAHIYLPVFYELQVVTSYEYLELRFNKYVRVLASTCFTIQMVLYMAIVVYAPALAMAQVTGFPVDPACAIIFGVCIFYTSLGGIKAVMWTDTFQAAVMFGSFLAIIMKGNSDMGGSSKVFDASYQSGRIVLFDFTPDPRMRHTVWSLLIGGYFTWISIYGINQTMVQRYLSVPKKSMAVRAIWMNVVGIGGLLLICAYAGLVIYAYYAHCDPITTMQVHKIDQLFPLFVMQVMGDFPGVPGLFVAGVFSGAMSTVSSGLNSLAAVWLKDFLGSAFGITLGEVAATRMTKVLAVVFGLLSYGVIFLVQYLPGVLEAALGIFGIVGGPVLGVFTLGMLFPFANSTGAFIGTLTSMAMTMWMGFGQSVARTMGHYSPEWVPTMNTSIANCPPAWLNYTTPPPVKPDPNFLHLPIYEVSYMWFSCFACLWTVIVGCLLSLASPNDHRQLDRRLVSPAFVPLIGFWNKRLKRRASSYWSEIGSDTLEKAELDPVSVVQMTQNGEVNCGMDQNDL